MSNDNLSANSAAGEGGGISDSATPVTLDPATSVTNNTALAGGGIFDPGAMVTLNGATVRGNHPDNCEPAGC